MAVTYTQVKELIPDCIVADAIITSIIADSTVFLNSVLKDNTVLVPSEVTAITKWFSAHMVVCGPQRQAKREKLGDAEIEYDAQTGTDLSSTSYGRMALALDRTGLLKASGKQAIRVTAVTSFK